ncbi:hypothetical protein QBC33DRAFT_302708 [Phialemonium atrogriseum]|uniref:Uncharacterized protein n=1 Tax=Phialemonium atrogriseum TaxID=1093897 RepID=A0AAJ0FR84_9PEZI|nr:uncharacterized protein QBC33DRAFT_302708 [Phialemonium atrogriseum]KAK1769875.1 hypothetical protein QBC33DRAFT_302708 [Phialemonium atrogriseum]
MGGQQLPDTIRMLFANVWKASSALLSPSLWIPVWFANRRPNRDAPRNRLHIPVTQATRSKPTCGLCIVWKASREVSGAGTPGCGEVAGWSRNPHPEDLPNRPAAEKVRNTLQCFRIGCYVRLVLPQTASLFTDCDYMTALMTLKLIISMSTFSALIPLLAVLYEPNVMLRSSRQVLG